MFPWWLQAMVLSIVGILFYLVMIKRIRARSRPPMPDLMLTRESQYLSPRKKPGGRWGA